MVAVSDVRGDTYIPLGMALCLLTSLLHHSYSRRGLPMVAVSDVRGDTYVPLGMALCLCFATVTIGLQDVMISVR